MKWNDEVPYLTHYPKTFFLSVMNMYIYFYYAGSDHYLAFQVTPEDMEAYRMKKVHHDDPMKDFLH